MREGKGKEEKRGKKEKWEKWEKSEKRKKGEEKLGKGKEGKGKPKYCMNNYLSKMFCGSLIFIKLILCHTLLSVTVIYSNDILISLAQGQ